VATQFNHCSQKTPWNQNIISQKIWPSFQWAQIVSHYFPKRAVLFGIIWKLRIMSFVLPPFLPCSVDFSSDYLFSWSNRIFDKPNTRKDSLLCCGEIFATDLLSVFLPSLHIFPLRICSEGDILLHRFLRVVYWPTHWCLLLSCVAPSHFTMLLQQQ